MRIAVIGLFVASIASAEGRPPIGATATIDRVAARVNGKPIWRSDVEERVATVVKATGEAAKPEAYTETLDALIDQTVILSRADELHITTNDAEIDAAIDTVKKANQIDDKQLETALASQGLSRAQYRVELGVQIRMQRTLYLELAPKLAISEDDILKAYAQIKTAKPDAPAMDAKLHDELKEQLTMKLFESARDPWLKKRRLLAHVEKMP